MNSLFLGLGVCFVAYLIVDFLCTKLGVEKLINSKASIRITLFLFAVLFNIAGRLAIGNYITREYQFLLRCFLTGATFYFIVFLLPFKNRKTKL
ncbi:hypothetical protein psyc5s11_27830 [Clostridium gelidum]|uniref:Uncharacterized protein n=1 Tax=Clostridium gelidum TaxID=704125 RepID=A0ABN6IX46_9CLOT|nr:hypothetical protein [Clostridium gelidum]BCZ46716.1 hypothetical protein psyc5s11_27830 [Clostridium gelidum]